MYKEEFMKEAIALAHKCMEDGSGGPFGVVIVKDGRVVGRGRNRVTADNDPTAHAEVMAIRDACRQLDTFQLDGCEIYTSCEPCPMCFGAIYWAHIDRIYYAANQYDASDAGFDDSFIYKEIDLPKSERSIPFEQHERADAVKVFEQWKKWEGRIDY
ncbi:MAG: nucleoside deaminase [Bacteroidales bacterium]|nr:nucleoside deaminase [Bacteroidales bacterium]